MKMILCEIMWHKKNDRFSFKNILKCLIGKWAFTKIWCKNIMNLWLSNWDLYHLSLKNGSVNFIWNFGVTKCNQCTKIVVSSTIMYLIRPDSHVSNLWINPCSPPILFILNQIFSMKIPHNFLFFVYFLKEKQFQIPLVLTNRFNYSIKSYASIEIC